MIQLKLFGKSVELKNGCRVLAIAALLQVGIVSSFVCLANVLQGAVHS